MLREREDWRRLRPLVLNLGSIKYQRFIEGFHAIILLPCTPLAELGVWFCYPRRLAEIVHLFCFISKQVSVTLKKKKGLHDIVNTLKTECFEKHIDYHRSSVCGIVCRVRKYYRSWSVSPSVQIEGLLESVDYVTQCAE